MFHVDDDSLPGASAALGHLPLEPGPADDPPAGARGTQEGGGGGPLLALGLVLVGRRQGREVPELDVAAATPKQDGQAIAMNVFYGV